MCLYVCLYVCASMHTQHVPYLDLPCVMVVQMKPVRGTDSEYTQSYVIMWLCAWHANSTGTSLWRGFIGWCVSEVRASAPVGSPLICPEQFPNCFCNKDESLIPSKSFPFFKFSALQNWPREVIIVFVSIPYLWITVNYFHWSLYVTYSLHHLLNHTASLWLTDGRRNCFRRSSHFE